MTGSQRIAVLFSPAFRRSSLASMATFFAFGGAYAGSAFFFPTFFTLERGYSPAAAAWLVGLSNGIAILGYMAAAFVGEFLLTRRTVFALWCVGGALALLGLLWLSASRDQDVMWYAVMAGFFFGSQAVMVVLIAEIFPLEVRATGLAVCASAPLSLGFALFPLAVPLLVQHFGWQLGLTMIVFPLLIVAGLSALALPNRASGLEIEEVAHVPVR
jgi:MFS family permease